MTGVAALLLGTGGVAGSAGASPLLPGARPGLWSVSTSANGHDAVRRCLADPDQLLRWGHRPGACRTAVVRADDGTRAVQLRCGADFGEARGRMITPRTARIEVQGIRGGLPFAQTLHARRVGNCRTAR